VLGLIGTYRIFVSSAKLLKDLHGISFSAGSSGPFDVSHDVVQYPHQFVDESSFNLRIRVVEGLGSERVPVEVKQNIGV